MESDVSLELAPSATKESLWVGVRAAGRPGSTSAPATESTPQSALEAFEGAALAGDVTTMRAMVARGSPLAALWDPDQGSGCSGELMETKVEDAARSSFAMCILDRVLGEGPYHMLSRNAKGAAVCRVTGIHGNVRRVTLVAVGRTWRLSDSTPVAKL
jgi:hypothetical protein